MMSTDRNGRHIPVNYCSCGVRTQGNGSHAAHRKMHQRKGDGHRPVTRDVYELCMSNPLLRLNCECGAGDALGREHRSDPPCPAFTRWERVNGPPVCPRCGTSVDDDGECRCEECKTCLGAGRIRDGETHSMRKCLDCNGAGCTVRLDSGMKWRNTADGVLWAVDKGGPIQPETLEHLLALLREKTDYPHHVAVEVTQGALLRTIDNENDAQETIRRLDAAPRKAKRSA